MGEERPELGQGPVGDSTRLAIGIAGIYRRDTTYRVAAFLALAVVALFGGLVILDVSGQLTLPGMGVVYDAAGIADPNAGREVRRVEEKLEEGDLTATERAALVERLLAAEQRARADVATVNPLPPSTEGVVDTRSLADKEREVVDELFADPNKKETPLLLEAAQDAPAPNLPDGLTGEAMAKVIADNSSSMSLCIAEAARKGETLTGRMEVSITVAADGRVTETAIETPRFVGSVVGACAGKRIRNWQFPRFNGEPVTVIFPYVLQ